MAYTPPSDPKKLQDALSHAQRNLTQNPNSQGWKDRVAAIQAAQQQQGGAGGQLPGTPVPTGSPTPNSPVVQNPLQNIITKNTDINGPVDLLNAGTKAGNQQNITANRQNNPNVNGPFGNSQVTIDPVTGQPTMTNTLSGGNQGVVQGQQGNSIGASGALQGILGSSPFASLNGAQGGFQGQAQPTSGIEQAVYGQLTQGFDRQKGQQSEDMAQNLANRGIPVGSPAWKNAMDDFSQNWNSRYDQAKNNAVTTGWNAQNQALGTLSGISDKGFYDPSTGQASKFNGQAYNAPTATDVYNAWANAQQGQGQLAIAGMNANTAQMNAGTNAAQLGIGFGNLNLAQQKFQYEQSQNPNPAFTSPPPGSG